MAKKTKFLVETSAVPVALGESTPHHCSHFRSVVGGGKLFTSVYIRKEFIHRWILDYITMAFEVEHFRSLSDALLHLNQDFSIRAVKTKNHAIAMLLKEKGKVENGRSAAKELGRLAVWELKKFDRAFRSRLPHNRSGCKLGGKEMRVDFDYFFDDLRKFVESQDVVTDCEINEFLGFANNGNAPRLLQVEDVSAKTDAGKKLESLVASQTWITCKECRTIGDAVIAMEQPKAFFLLHIDRAFKVLCAATDRLHKPILSERAAENEVAREP